MMRLHRTCFLLPLLLLCRLAVAQEDRPIEVDAGNYRTPLKAVPLADYPAFDDDYDLRDMRKAIDRQLARFKQKSLRGTIRMGTKVYPLTKAQASLEAFSGMIDDLSNCLIQNSRERCFQDLNQQIRQRFDVYVPNLQKGDPRFGDEKFARFTAYHTQNIEGRLQPEGEFQYAIYSNPNNRKLNSKTRVQIDFASALGGLGLEQVFTNHIFDIYLMHVAGSGKASIPQPDGSVKEMWLQYDGTNKQRWEFVSLYMAKKGYITNGSIPAQRKFLRDHPELAREIFAQCPSYVYLRASAEPPKGSDSVAVTDGRTLATDTAYYPFKGLLSYIQTQRPVESESGKYDLDEEDLNKIPFQPFSRFLIDQDTGGAINGKARADIYFGSTEYAFFTAMHQDQLGKMHYLMLK